ncbi:hypothetical protein BRADI_4g05415v3 [Brachypodium distachyon]|uniref:Uncharacterized protein n=1 Tax=Brachypodium distachyon TaxID=15368 RepID=A0A2K2CKM4_BRADI|nr:hypothetical protein BRADI_4g05415v3 [Brachypodium distachyon]
MTYARTKRRSNEIPAQIDRVGRRARSMGSVAGQRRSLPDVSSPCRATAAVMVFRSKLPHHVGLLLPASPSGVVHTYGEVEILSQRAVAGLRRLGVGKGDLLLLLPRNCLSSPSSSSAFACLGAATTIATRSASPSRSTARWPPRALW